jgi:hypothetical protein
VYYLENGATGVMQRGVYRLHDDVIQNGHCNDPGESTLYYAPTALAGTAFHWGMCLGTSGWSFYVLDSGNDVVWKVADLNGDLAIASGTAEEVLYWQAPGSSLNWGVTAASDGSIFTAESQSPDRILRMADELAPNGTVNDPGEVVAVYDETISPVNIGNPRSVAFDRRPTLTIPPTPSVGSTVPFLLDADEGHAFSVWLSTGFTAIPVPPLGIVELALWPPYLYAEIYSGNVPAGSRHGTVVTLPSSTALIGTSLHFQGFAGLSSRVRMTNRQTLTFQR